LFTASSDRWAFMNFGESLTVKIEEVFVNIDEETKILEQKQTLKVLKEIVAKY